MNPKTAQTIFKILLEVGKTVINILENRSSNKRSEPNAKNNAESKNRKP